MSGKVYPLLDNQREAVDPRRTVWLSASAGTGKTQVLSARVLRLLMQDDVSPSQILCLTFTKAGAAEMATRVNEVLASWVRMPGPDLFNDLEAIGAPSGPQAQDRARTLFASVLDCPGGGLRVDTIHAFAQWLLSAFPQEAGLSPGTRAMEDRDRALLAHDVLSRMVAREQEQGDRALLDTISALSVRFGPDGVTDWLMRCAAARDAWEGPGALTPPMIARVRQIIGLPADFDDDALAAMCADDAFPVSAARSCAQVMQQWKAKTGQEGAQILLDWLARAPHARLSTVGLLKDAFFTQKGTPRAMAGAEKIDPAFAQWREELGEGIVRVEDAALLLDLADFIAPALEAGRQLSRAWEEAKAREGLIDFDDQIRQAALLLKDQGVGSWIRYKLDRRFDHILVDEAQDTNGAQWAIIDALTDDFFSGIGQRDEKLRTLFVVGDYKQAIFRFQGTSPENFRLARDRVAQRIAGLRQAMEGYRGALPIPDLQEYGLGRSFRTAAPVLEFVDAAIHAIGPETFGLDHVPTPHEGQDRPGLVTLWPVIGAVDEDAADDAGEAEEAGWIARPDRVLAETIARQVSNWMKDGFPLVKGGSRLAGPGDVMVLVRRRRDLAGLIVARLYAHGVPVAGVDRLRVGDPLAVQDLMAALRFAAQPLDDLSLACLLVSPIMGWTQDDLMLHAMRPEKMGLWKHLRESSDPMVMETVQRLRDLLNRADYEAPHAMLHWMLTGPWAARRALVARLGEEANDPINELLNAAFAFSSAHVASLQGFIRWFDAGDGELKREADGGGGQVRVMTVHGSKGLQAPIVILADAAGRPGSGPSSAIDLPIDPLGEDVSRRAPIPALPQDQQRGAIAAEYETVRAAEMEEHWRLLYVAMTRAEEALFIGGSLGLKEKAPHEDSWYARLAPLFDGDGVEDALWQGTRFEWGEAPAMEAGMAPASNDNAASPRAPLPDWAMRPIGPEPRPPRPLAPSGAGEDLAPDPPIRAGGDPLAAQRGTLIHALLERLPNVAPDQRASTARAWLERRGQDFDDAALDEMVASALAVMDDARFARVFAPGSLAEVPLSATVGGTVIAGTADRLVVNPDEVMVVDYKTTRRPPASASEIPAATLAQMAAYVAALRTIYPGRRVTAGLLYTHAPALFALDEDALAPAIDRLRMR